MAVISRMRMDPTTKAYVARRTAATTGDTIYFGFGFEGMTDAADGTR
jgi:hypothetical protein